MRKDSKVRTPDSSHTTSDRQLKSLKFSCINITERPNIPRDKGSHLLLCCQINAHFYIHFNHKDNGCIWFSLSPLEKPRNLGAEFVFTGPHSVPNKSAFFSCPVAGKFFSVPFGHISFYNQCF